MMQETWVTGDVNQRHQVLVYLAKIRPVEGVDIAWEALCCEDEMLRATAAIATWEYVRHGVVPGSEQMDALVSAAKGPGWASSKYFLLRALEQGGYGEYEGLLRDLTLDESADVRFDANLELLRRGRDTKRTLFADLDKLGWNFDFGVERLWWVKDLLNLSVEEEERLRTHMQAKVAGHRAACRGEHPDNSALILFHRLQEGFPAEPDDVDLVGEAVSHVHSQRERIDAARAVAWFNNDRAREWLKRLGSEPYQPSVRREAQKQLKRLTAR
jgi:hypothetical protein